MTKGIGFVMELGVTDVQASIDFYTEHLGCHLVESVSNDSGRPIWAEVAFGDSTIMFQQADLLAEELRGISSSNQSPRFALVIRMAKASAFAVLRHLQEISCSIETGPTETDYGSYEFSCFDPDKYVVLIAGRD
jgi:uncharacterized glyoxalase superfamily protein PhnB